jgi:hypothetical protein
MTVHVTKEAPIVGIVPINVVLKLTNNTSINAIKIEARELIEGDLVLIAYHYEDLSNVWIDESTIVNVTFPETNGDTSVTWFTDNTQLYYWQDGSFYYADSSVYTGDTSNFEPVTTTITNNVSDSWSFSLAYEVNVDTLVYSPITKATKISIGGVFIVKYYRGSVEIFPVLVEDSLPPSTYKTDIITIASGNSFDFRRYTNVISGYSIGINHRRRRRDRTGSWLPEGSVALTWYNSTAIDASVRKVETINNSIELNYNSHGGGEQMEKDFSIACFGGSTVTVYIRTLHYPVVAKAAETASDLTQLLSTAIHNS